MYSRDFGGIRSEGQLYNLEREYNESRNRHEHNREPEFGRGRDDPHTNDDQRFPDCEKPKGLGMKLDFLRDLRLDDLILIGIGILLLLDSDSENDIFVFLIAFLLMFN